MKSILVALFLAVMATTAFSGAPSKEEYVMVPKSAVVSTEKEKSPSTAQETKQIINEWAELGSNIGKGLVATAKELGVAANEFATTPLGKIAVGLIVYKVVGQDLVRFLKCVVFYILAQTVIVMVVRRSMNMPKSFRETPYSLLWGLKTGTKLVPEKFVEMDSGERLAIYFFAGLVSILVLTISVVNI